MGVCYLANPVHQQISSVFHEISHALESPETVLSHPQQKDHSHDAHEEGAHRLAANDHRHKLLDFMNSIFNASDEQNSDDETALILIKCDKHISSQQSILPKLFPLITSHYPFGMEQKVKKGFFNLPKEPPQRVYA